MEAEFMTEDPTERMNRNLEDVFWLRHGREPDWANHEDRIRGAVLMEWQCRGAPLPPQDEAEITRRLKAQDLQQCAQARLTGGRGPFPQLTQAQLLHELEKTRRDLAAWSGRR